MKKRKRTSNAGLRKTVVFGTGRRPGHHDGNRWLTPPWLVERIRKALGGTISLDPCTEPDNPTGARTHYTVKQDGLQKRWRGRRIFINPPYGDVRPWIAKAIRVSRSGAKIFMLLPVRTDAEYHHELLDEAVDVLFVRGRLRFTRPSRQETTGAAAFCSMIVGLNVSCKELADLGLLYSRIRK